MDNILVFIILLISFIILFLKKNIYNFLINICFVSLLMIILCIFNKVTFINKLGMICILLFQIGLLYNVIKYNVII